MTDRGIIFSGPMVRALLAGRKTQTRRVLKPQPEPWKSYYLEESCQRSDWHFELGTSPDKRNREIFGLWGHSAHNESVFQPLPYEPGDRLYVRENFYLTDDGDTQYAVFAADELEAAQHINDVGNIAARNGFGKEWLEEHTKLRPSIHMPKEFSRLTLAVTDVKVERVQDISEADAEAEGIFPLSRIGDDPSHPQWTHARDAAWRWETARQAFQALWDSLNTKRGFGWDSNPWVCAITSNVHHQNIDALEKAA